MRVDVDLQRVERQVQEPGRVAAAVAHVAVAEAHGAAEQPVADHAAVDEQVLAVRLRARGRRQPDPALEREARLRELDVARGGDEVRARRASRCAPRARGRSAAGGSANCSRRLCVSVKATSKRDSARRVDGPQDVLELGRLGAQELAPRRHAVKQVAHLDRRARRMRGRRRARRAAVDRLDRDRVRRAARARGDAQARHRRDRRQRLAAEAEGGDALEVLERRDLAGGVARERERQLRGRDAAAVVAHADQADAAVLDVDRDLPGAGVERVLDQLLDDGRRALDHLARGDLVDERAFEDRMGMAWRCVAMPRQSSSAPGVRCR